MTTTKGRAVVAGDAITFAPGREPIHVARIEAEQHLHSALQMTYRIVYDVAGFGYALFDEQTVWTVPAPFGGIPMTSRPALAGGSGSCAATLSASHCAMPSP